MTWACRNGHPVREGMFTCPVCGSDDVRERSGVEGPPPVVAPATAVERLRNFLVQGIGMYLGGSVLAGLALLLVANRVDSGAFEAFLLLVAGVLTTVGIGFVLVAVVGWGVKLGNEATERVDAR